MKITLPLIFLTFILAACSPDAYILKRDQYIIARGFKMSGIDDVKIIGENAIALDSNAATSWKSIGLTQGIADLTLEVLGGEGLRFYSRSAPNNFNKHENICFHYLVKGSYITENGRKIAEFPQLKAAIDREDRIKFINDGENYDVIFNCDTLYQGKTKIPATEYLIIQTLPKTRALLYGIDIIEIYDSSLPYFQAQ